jgi:hypothetical protein
MEWMRSKKKLLIMLCLSLLIWLNHNQMTNWHFHIMSNGTVVMHAHPYKSNTIPETPFQQHHHNNVEFLILSLIFNTIPLLVALLVFSFLSKFKISKLYLFPAAENRLRGFYRTLLLRGPPGYSIR